MASRCRWNARDPESPGLGLTLDRDAVERIFVPQPRACKLEPWRGHSCLPHREPSRCPQRFFNEFTDYV